LKRSWIAASTALAVFVASAAPARAQTPIAAGTTAALDAAPIPLGVKIAGKVLMSILGKVFHIGIFSLLDSGPEPVTPEQLEAALTAHFKEQYARELSDEYRGLAESMGNYKIENRTLDRRLDDVDAIVRSLDRLIGKMRSNVGDKARRENFWQLMPVFLLLHQARITFYTEQAHLDMRKAEEDSTVTFDLEVSKRFIAKQALSGLEDIKTQFSDYVLTGNVQCFGIEHGTELRDERGEVVEARFIHGGKTACVTDPDAWSGLYRKFLPQGWYFRQKGIYKIPAVNEVGFLYKARADDPGLVFRDGYANTDAGRAAAAKDRARIAMVNYPEVLGDVKALAGRWAGIVHQAGDATQRARVQVLHDWMGLDFEGAYEVHAGRNRGSTLHTGEQLLRGDWMMSSNGRYKLEFQQDQNLCLYNVSGGGRRFLWCSGSNGRGGTRVVMQGDGNLAMYRRDHYVWGTGRGRSQPHMVVQDDGNMCMYGDGNQFYWCSNTAGR
jgi:hypothetical protein